MDILDEGQVRSLASMSEIVREVEDAFRSLSLDQASLPAGMHIDFPEAEGEVHVKGAHIHSSDYFVVKIATGFYGNPSHGLAVSGGCVLVLSARTGFPLVLLVDNGLLTDMRTGAAGAVAAKYMARSTLEKVGVIGSGMQARQQIRGLAEVRDVPRVEVWSRDPQNADTYAEDMRAEGFDVAVARDPKSVVVESDLVITTTPSRTPIVRAEWLSPGVHINAVGSDTPDKQELDPMVLVRADSVVVDRLNQCLDSGELHHAVDGGFMEATRVQGELGDVVSGRVAGRVDDYQITVCDLTGVGVQDAAAASVVLDAARLAGILGTHSESDRAVSGGESS